MCFFLMQTCPSHDVVRSKNMFAYFKDNGYSSELHHAPPSYDQAILTPAGFVAPPISQYPPPTGVYPYLEVENQTPPEESTQIAPPAGKNGLHRQSSQHGKVSQETVTQVIL